MYWIISELFETIYNFSLKHIQFGVYCIYNTLREVVYIQLELVIFDLDGTLVDTERISIEAWKSVAKAKGVRLEEKLFNEMIGSSKDNSQKIFQKLFPEMDLTDLRRDKEEIFLNLIKTNPSLDKAGVKDLLIFLQQHSIKTAIATNTERYFAREVIVQSGLAQLVDFIAYRDDVANGKPAPDLYQHVLDYFELPSNRALAVEDSNPGIQSATAAQLKTIFVPDLAELSIENTTKIYRREENLAGLLEFLQKTIGGN